MCWNALSVGDIQFNGDFWVRPKLPNEKLTTLPWHQDSAYMPHTENDTHLTVWLPLVDVKTENGALQFLPGSHKQVYRRITAFLTKRSLFRFFHLPHPIPTLIL